MKKIMKIFLSTMLVISMIFFTGCSADEDNSEETTSSSSSELLTYPEDDYTADLGESTVFEDGDEILITESGTYEFSGDYVESTITVNVDKEVDEGIVYLVLNNANLESDTDAPINIIEAKDVVIVLEDDSTNTITQGNIETDDEEFPNGAIYTAADTVITGDGSLTIDTEYKDGINGRDDLIIECKELTIISDADGIVGKDFLAIKDTVVTIDAGNDGMKSTNSDDEDRGNLLIESGIFDITAETDGIAAENILQINDGEFDIESGGGYVEVLNDITVGEGSGSTVSATSLLENSMKGIKGSDIWILGGIFEISSYEDGIHANNDLIIYDGDIAVLSGDDAIHAENYLTINDGNVTVTYAYEGIEANYITINGGNIEVAVLDDAINGSSDTGLIYITGGNIYVESSGDGIDANGDLTIEGGDIVLNVSAIYTGGDSELDVSGTYTYTGGSVTDENGNDVDASESGMSTMQQPSSGGHSFR